MNDYQFMYLNLERDSGLLQQGRSNDNRRKISAALDVLVSRSVLISDDTDVRNESEKKPVNQKNSLGKQ